MTTCTETVYAEWTGRSGKLLLGSAIVFAATYAVAMFVPSLPEGAYSDARVLSLLEAGGDRTRIILGGYALVASAVAVLVFAAALRSRLTAVGSVWPSLVQLAAVGYAGALVVAAAMFSSIPMGVAIGELEPGDPAHYRAMSNAGFHLLLVSGLALASLMVVSASVALRGIGGTPRWLPITGFVIAALLLLGFAWIPQFLVPIWAVVTAATVGDR